ADPVGDPSRLWAAAATLGLDRESVIPAIEDGLILINPSVRFAHPLVRSAVYQAASPADRRDAHAALAVATCASADRTAAPGTALRPRSVRTRRSLVSSIAAPSAPGDAAGSRPPPPSGKGRP